MQLTIREPGSAITHFIGCLMALIAASPLLIKAHGNTTYMLAMTIFARKTNKGMPRKVYCLKLRAITKKVLEL